ncbi:thioredoxin family protein [Ekhidna sp.]|uniref:thioredoxin family protein n=1 Tax=Ekhidna sp. TaxID=2608089 RepID=UPI003B5CF536
MKRTFILIVGVMAVVAVLFMNASEPVAGYGVGDYAQDFKLPNVDGKMVSMADYNNAEGFIVVFTCNTCPYAKAYESRIIDLDKKYASQGFPVIAINPNDVKQQPGDSMDEMKKRANNKGYSFPYLRDDSQEVAKAFGATKTPHVYVLNKESNGKYRVEFIGAIDDSPNDPSDVSETYVEDAIDAIKAGNKPTVTEKRAIGCTIKWKS